MGRCRNRAEQNRGPLIRNASAFDAAHRTTVGEFFHIREAGGGGFVGAAGSMGFVDCVFHNNRNSLTVETVAVAAAPVCKIRGEI